MSALSPEREQIYSEPESLQAGDTTADSVTFLLPPFHIVNRSSARHVSQTRGERIKWFLRKDIKHAEIQGTTPMKRQEPSWSFPISNRREAHPPTNPLVHTRLPVSLLMAHSQRWGVARDNQMIEKASNLWDRHQEKSEGTNVMWESREIKKKQNYSWIVEVQLFIEKAWCYKKEQTEDSYEFLRIKTVIEEIFKELNKSRNIKRKMGKFFWKWDRGKRDLEVKESCSLSQRPTLSSFIRIL